MIEKWRKMRFEENGRILKEDEERLKINVGGRYEDKEEGTENQRSREGNEKK